MSKTTKEVRGEHATEREDSLNNARAMMGWDSEPAVVIERPRVIAEKMPNGEFIERTIPAYVKYSTAFKEELKKISGSALKVWTYIALSINEKGIAFPGIRTIAEGCDLSHQTVITVIKELEAAKLLHVTRGDKRYNLYQPSDDYVAIFDNDPKAMSQKIGTVKKLESSPLDSNKTDVNDNGLAFLSKLYEKNIGLIYNTHLADELKEYSSFPREWLDRAFQEAANANARNWRYVRTCLDNWKRAGKITEKKAKPGVSAPPPPTNDLDYFERLLA
jgi:DnaD/phage-associated family protein